MKFWADVLGIALGVYSWNTIAVAWRRWRKTKSK